MGFSGGDTNTLVQRSSYVNDFWSDVQDKVTVDDSVSQNPALPDIVVSGLPTGISLTRVVLLLKVRAIENTDADPNAVNGAQVIEVKEDSEEWTAALPAINLVDNMWEVAGATKEAGDVLLGDNDVKTTVSGNGTYNARWASALVDAADLELFDIQVGFRMFWEVE